MPPTLGLNSQAVTTCRPRDYSDQPTQAFIIQMYTDKVCVGTSPLVAGYECYRWTYKLIDWMPKVIERDSTTAFLNSD